MTEGSRAITFVGEDEKGKSIAIREATSDLVVSATAAAWTSKDSGSYDEPMIMVDNG